MAIVKMNKFTLFTFESHRDNLLKELQKIEAVHFKNLQAAESGEIQDFTKVSIAENLSFVETELAKLSFVLSKTEPYYNKPKGLKGLSASPPELSFAEFDSFTESYDYSAVYNSVKAMDERQKSLKAEKTKLKSENITLSAWLKLDVSTNELNSLKSVDYMLGTLPKQSAESFLEILSNSFPNIYIEFLGTIKEDSGVLIVMSSEDSDEVSTLAKLQGFTKISLVLDETPENIVNSNNLKIAEIEQEESRLTDEIKAQSLHYEKMKISYDYFKTLSERYSVCGNFLKTENICLIEGWTAESDTEIFKSAIERGCGNDYFLESAPVEKDSEEVPIKLKNNKFVSAFEGVTEMYSMPKYDGIDPTPLLTPFYLLFFAMMVGDVGYGILLVLGTALSLKFLKLKKSMQRFFRFFLYLGISTIIVGTLYGSLFGVTFFAPRGGKPILDLTSDIMFMLILSVAIGVVQIIVGLFIKGYILVRNGKILDAVFDSLFWILAVSSFAGLLALGVLGTLPGMMTICGWVFAGALVGLAFTQGRSSPSLGGKIGNGIYSVYNITGYVGDFVSYTRLTAIALAGAYIAFSFNLMGGLLIENPGSLPLSILKYIFAAVVVTFGALLNLGLGALGSYVHTCRLQYVEYFSKFYDGGGLPFKAFSLKNTFININIKK